MASNGYGERTREGNERVKNCVERWSNSVPIGYFGGCIVDGVWMPLTDSAFYSPSQVFLLSCQVPPHAPGEVSNEGVHPYIKLI